MHVHAVAKYIRISPRKLRLVADTVRGLDVLEAKKFLEFTRKRSAKHIKDIIASAIANATHNDRLDEDNLFVEKIFVNPGPTLKRFQPRAQGRAYRILKRTSHVTVILSERKPTKRKKAGKQQLKQQAEQKQQIAGEKGTKEEKEGLVKAAKEVADKDDTQKKDIIIPKKAMEQKIKKPMMTRKPTLRDRFFRRRGDA